MRKTVCLVLTAVLLLLSACDRLADMLEIPDPARESADAQAIGSGCRQTGRSIEDCYALNPDAQRAAIFMGWKAMNEYMIERNLTEVPSLVARSKAPVQRSSHGPAQSTIAQIPQPQIPQPQVPQPQVPQPQVAAH